MDAAIAKPNASGARKDYKREIVAKVGRSHIRQANLFDPDGVRVELMKTPRPTVCLRRWPTSRLFK
jgi:hypothetical protein